MASRFLRECGSGVMWLDVDMAVILPLQVVVLRFLRWRGSYRLCCCVFGMDHGSIILRCCDCDVNLTFILRRCAFDPILTVAFVGVAVFVNH